MDWTFLVSRTSWLSTGGTFNPQNPVTRAQWTQNYVWFSSCIETVMCKAALFPLRVKETRLQL